jgi:hypothetical protein
VEHKRTITYQDGKIEVEDFVRLATNEETSGSIQYFLDKNIKSCKNGEDVILSMQNGQTIKVNVQGVESIELIPTDYSPAYGQSVETTMITGLFKANKETRIKTIIIIK